MRGRLSAGALIPLLALAVLGLSLWAACVGQVHVAPMRVLGTLLDHLHLPGPAPADSQGDDVLWVVRFPRIALALGVGAALGCAGAVMQGIFGNPLAEPGVIGVSSGSAVGAFSVIVLGWTFLGSWTVVVFAFVCGVITTLVVYGLSRSGGRTEVVTLVLTGISVNALTGAVIGILTFVSDDDSLRAITFWNLGSLASASWSAVWVVVPCALVGIAICMAHSRQLDLLALGERSARHLGVDIERLRLRLIVVVALLSAAAVAFSGIIAFVGLVVPHLIRMAIGPSHKALLPASALGGALVLVSSDLIARTAVDFQEIPLGILTALIGGPFFFWLLRKTRSHAGGWG